MLAVRLYQNGYTVTEVQKFLRTEKIPTKNLIKTVKESILLIDKALEKSPKFNKETVLWRGVDIVDLYCNNMIDRGYTSTAKTLNSTVKSWSIGGKILRILAPKNMNYIDINSYLKREDIDGIEQEEILLPRNLKFEFDPTFRDYETYRVSTKSA
jgi:hypothetical protein